MVERRAKTRSGPVSRVLCPRISRGDGHLSRTPIARRLQRPTRESMASRTDSQRPSSHLLPAWSCSGWGLPSQPGHPGCWCALTAPFHPCLIPRSWGCAGHRRSILCGTFPRLAAGRRYRPPCPAEPGLSSRRSARRGEPAGDHPAHFACHFAPTSSRQTPDIILRHRPPRG